MPDDRTITTVYKVISELIAGNFVPDFDTGTKVLTSFKLTSSGQFNADFGKNLLRTGNHLPQQVTFC